VQSTALAGTAYSDLVSPKRRSGAVSTADIIAAQDGPSMDVGYLRRSGDV
jgi:hypothetical protein